MAAELPPVEIPVEKAGTPTLEATADNTVPPTLAPKRQRRPSVRLGEIGDQPATLRAASKSWKFNPPFNTKPSNRTRPLTNLVTSNGDGTSSYEYDASPLEINGNFIFDSSLFFADRPKFKEKDFKTTNYKKTTTTSKRVGTNWESTALDEERERHNGVGGQEGFRDFDPEASPTPSPLREESADNVVRVEEWRAHSKRSRRVRVSDGSPPDEEVRNWLTELGLGKYSPVFEIHEVDEQVLPFLTMEDLKDMGINAVGSRRKMFCAIQKLRKGFS